MKNGTLDKKLVIDHDKCIHCGLCLKTCWNGALSLGKDGFPTMELKAPKDEWNMCWECQRCLAVCPSGALSIRGKSASDCIPRSGIASPQAIEALVVNRRSCRSYRDENVDGELIDHILHVAGNSPTGSCNQLVEYTVITDKESMRDFADLFHRELFAAADRGVFPGRFTREDIAFFRTKWEAGESFLFRGAPHALFVHAPIGRGEWVFDTQIALTYVELMMESYGLGTIYVSTPLAALDICPQSRAFLEIPEDHYITGPLGFGWPAYRFARGVDRSDALKIHHLGVNPDEQRTCFNRKLG